MKIGDELRGARLSIARTAELIAMDAGYLRKLVRRGIFPQPKRTSKGMPFYDYELLCKVGEVLKSGVGVSGEEVSFYRRKPKQSRPRSRQSPCGRQRVAREQDAYITSIIEGCRQVGVGDDLLNEARIKAVLTAEFGADRPDLERALPVVARKLLGGGA